jgi:hypothetical protein
MLMTVYAIISFVAFAYLNVDLSGAYFASDMSTEVRARALFAEGGEFGLYTVSIILVAAFRHYVLRDTRSPWYLWAFTMPILGAGLITSKSKSGAVCLLAILGWSAIRHLRLRYAFAGAALGGLLVLTTPIISSLEAYWSIYQNFDRIAYAFRNDVNIAAGRASAISVIPEMVKLHPLLGIGIGNYGLLRADPKIGIPAADIWDLGGLGLFDYSAQFGLPLFLYFLWLVWRPWRLAKQVRPQLPDVVLMIAGFQLFAEGIEVQPTFVYPWLVSAIAMGFWISPSGVPQTRPHGLRPSSRMPTVQALPS